MGGNNSLRGNEYSTLEDTLASLLWATRARRAGPDRWMGHCPAHPDRTPSLSIALCNDRILLHCFAGCPTENILDALGLTWRNLFEGGDVEPYRPLSLPSSPSPLEVQRERWERWWAAARENHPVLRRYLRARGLTVEPPPTLRVVYFERTPFMVARITGPDGSLRGLHLTELAQDGSRRGEKRLARGSRPQGGAIRLYPLESGPLALAEGIETALAIHEITGYPAWACISAGGLKGVVLPPDAHEIIIGADHDQAGLEAAEELARRLLAEGRRVRLAVPPKVGQDWLDALKEARHA